MPGGRGPREQSRAPALAKRGHRAYRPTAETNGYVVRATSQRHAEPPLTAKLDTGPKPQPSTPPHKAPKRTHNDVQTRDIPHGERASPARRYKGKGSRLTAAPQVHPLSLYDTHGPHTNANWSPIEDNTFFLPNAPASPTPSSSASPALPLESPLDPPDNTPSPSPSIASRSSSPTSTLSTRSRSRSAPAPSPSAATQTAPPSPSLTAVPDDDDPMDTPNDTAFRGIMREAFMAKIPAGRDINPHRPHPAHDPNDPTAIPQYTTVQMNDPTWTACVLPDHRRRRPTTKEKPLTLLGLVVFCYGGLLASKFKNIHAEILRPLEEVAGKGNVTLIRPQVKEAIKSARRGLRGKADKYPPPIALLARCEDPEARARLTGQVTFAATPSVGFHCVAFDPARMSWAIGFFQTDISDPPEVTGRCLAWAVYENVRDTPTLFSMFDRATQGGSKISRDQRLLDWAATFDVRFLPHDKTPVYVLFVQPCTENALLWDTVRPALRVTHTDDLEAFKPHGNARSGHNLCADCKYDDHPRFNCLFTKRDKAWWGPKGIDEILAELAGDGGGDDNGDEGDRWGAPAGAS
ncbi:hypothetical protein C8R44DRAFT_733962 [Mycena epipterygia]|nr:hypothetical protein C8R44DRAFT_733962 [Mycena epipterygia]